MMMMDGDDDDDDDNVDNGYNCVLDLLWLPVFVTYQKFKRLC